MTARSGQKDAGKPWVQLTAVAAAALVLAIAGASHPSTQARAVLGGGAQQAALETCEQLLQRKLAVKQALVQERNKTPLTVGARNRHEIFDRYEPAWACMFDQRLGASFGDGGKFVCGDDAYFRRSPCLVYSVGSNGDATFEKAVVKHFDCEVHTFDPTGDSAAYAGIVSAAGAEFHAWGLSGAAGGMPNTAGGVDVSNPLLPLGDIVEELGHAGRHIDILKVDCEGCEYEAFSPIWRDIKAGKYSIGQIQVELHVPRSQPWRKARAQKISQFFSGADSAGFAVFHKERNHWGCSGWACVEFSLIHLDVARQMLEFEVPGCA